MRKLTDPSSGYLRNSTTLSSPINVTVPALVGPSGDYYSIAIADLTADDGAAFSNRFNFTGGTGNYTEYENKLGGASFWNANDLPCSSYDCARNCAMASYPDDLTDDDAYETMKNCILQCPGVSVDEDQDGPAKATSSGVTTAGSSDASATDASASSSSTGAAGTLDIAYAGAAGLAGFAALLAV